MLKIFLRTVLFLAAAACIAMPAFAQDDDQAEHRFAGDLYRAGDEVRITDTNVEDLFAAGETVIVDADILESVHAAGRDVRVNRRVGDDLYAAGETVDINGAIIGDVTAAGYRIEIGSGGSVGEDVHLAGSAVRIGGPVSGDANLAGETVEIAAPIAGSAEIRASNIRFGDNARIDGTLTYWSPETIDIPASVIPPGRVTANIVEDYYGREETFASYLGGLVIFLIIGALFALIFPQTLWRAQDRIAQHPWASLSIGIIAASALLGVIVVFAVSIVGIVLIPFVVILIPVALIAGYFASAYFLGRAAFGLVRFEPGESRRGALWAVLAGIVILTVVRLVPFFGWLVAVAATLFGLGGLFALWIKVERQPRTTAP